MAGKSRIAGARQTALPMRGKQQARSAKGFGQKGFINDYLSYLLARAGYLVAEDFHREVKKAGLGIAEWRVLATLSGAEPLTIGRLADDVLFQQPTLTKVIDRMERDGLVKRVPGKSDRRERLVAIAPPGQRLAAPLMRKAKRHEAKVLRHFGQRQAMVLKDVLRGMIAQLEGAGKSASRR